MLLLFVLLLLYLLSLLLLLLHLLLLLLLLRRADLYLLLVRLWLVLFFCVYPYRYCEVGSRFKNPIFPLWVIGSGNHYTTLFALDPSAAGLPSEALAEAVSPSSCCCCCWLLGVGRIYSSIIIPVRSSDC